MQNLWEPSHGWTLPGDIPQETYTGNGPEQTHFDEAIIGNCLVCTAERATNILTVGQGALQGVALRIQNFTISGNGANIFHTGEQTIDNTLRISSIISSEYPAQ